jgi:hypothetical protein
LSKLTITGSQKKGYQVSLNRQPLTNVTELTLEMDATNLPVAHVSFVPRAVDIDAEVELVEENKAAKPTTKKKAKKGVSK